MTHPVTLSVVIPNYNHAALLPRALDSVLTQSRMPDEVIVADDASTDDSLRVLEAYEKKYPHFRVIRRKVNLGVVGNLLELYAVAKGDFVYSLGADDYILPGFFEKAMAVLEHHPLSGGCCCDLMVVEHPSGRVLNDCRFGVGDGFLAPQELAEKIGRKNFTATGPNTILRRLPLQEEHVLWAGAEWLFDWLAVTIIAFRYGLCHVSGSYQRISVYEGTFSFEGHTGRNARGKIVQTLTYLGQPEFANLLPQIKASGCVEQLGPAALEEMLRHRHLRKFLSSTLLRRTFVGWLKWRLLKIFPMLRIFGRAARSGRASENRA